VKPVKEEICRTSRGRIVKRPKPFYIYDDPEDEALLNCETGDEYALVSTQIKGEEDIISGGVGVTGAENQEDLNQSEEWHEDLMPPDPEWAPDFEDGNLSLLSASEVSESEGESVTESEAKDLLIKGPEEGIIEIPFAERVKKTKAKRKKTGLNRSSSRRKKQSEASVMRIPVKIEGNDGEIYEGVFIQDPNRPNAPEVAHLETGTLISMEEFHSMNTVRVYCAEPKCSRTFTSIESLKSHFFKIHSGRFFSLRW
jgi:hypothetical protein